MVENSENRPEEGRPDPELEDTEEVIELSDIAVGTTQEDEEIIELTEEVLDEAMGAVTRTTGEDDNEEVLDLSEAEQSDIGDAAALSEPEGGEDGAFGSEEPIASAEKESEEVEEQISHELDDYFGVDEPVKEAVPEEQTEMAPASMESEPDQPLDESASSEALEAKIERVIEEKFAERMEKVFSEIIEARLKENMEQLKKDLLEAREK
ncbi:MAG: hypothetical protein KGY61_06545 [Desulfobacterales bacterium]|nr:hypothetical protein [Desulfobacterales bacterium]